jgi:hypothetical protein
MKLNLGVLLLLLLAFTGPRSFSQDLTGIWRGHFNSASELRRLDSNAILDRYKFETQIIQKDKALEGVTYSYKTTVFYGKASCVGTVSTKSKKVILGEDKLLEVQSIGGGACLMTCFLQYSKVGEEEFLEGSFTAISVRDSTRCPGGTVFLRKVPTSDFYIEPFLAERLKEKTPPPVVKAQPPPQKTAPSTPPKKQSSGAAKAPPAKNNIAQKTAPKTNPPAVKKTPAPNNVAPKKTPPPPPIAKKNDLKTMNSDTLRRETPKVSAPVPIPRVLATRKNELVKTILSSAKEVSVKIYDNGTIDNDTVSVYLDNKLVISRQRLTEQAITLKINLDDEHEYHELVMVAENLGEIPPNTSLMVVDAGDEKYEVRITSNEQKNAVVRFAKKPKT